MKKRIFTVFITVFMLFNMGVTAFANAGPSVWYGADSASVVIMDDCPLIVEKEILTFDIYQKPYEYFEGLQENAEQYTDKFTAQYTFYNPTDTDITAQLAFPLGMVPDYINMKIDTEKYTVSVDNKEIEKEIRYTNSDQYYVFDYRKEAVKLIDGYMPDDFFSPDMTVTKYTLVPHTDEEIDYHREMRMEWDGNISDKTRIIPMGFDSFKWEEGQKAEIASGLLRKHNAVIYAVGQPLEKFPEYKFYDSHKDNAKQIDGYVEIKEEKTTLENLLVGLFADFSGNLNIESKDLYNMFICHISESKDYYEKLGIIHTDSFYTYNHVCWYLYEITVPAGQSVVNTVTAPVYPDVNVNYTPHKCDYTYLLSPAKEWADFKDIEININTPFYMLETNQSGFEKTETGYIYKGVGLPDGELEFTLCESETPQKDDNSEYNLFMFVYIVLPVGLFVGVIILFVFLIKNIDKKKKDKK